VPDSGQTELNLPAPAIETEVANNTAPSQIAPQIQVEASTQALPASVQRPVVNQQIAPVQAVPPAKIPPTSNYSVSLNVLEQRLYAGHMSARQQAGLGGLQIDGTLTAIARQRATDMATNNYFSHYAPGAPNRAAVFSLLAAYGYVSNISGENIARNNYSDTQSADVAMNAFMASPGHRDNILDGRFRYVGIGSALGANGMKYYAVVFAG
jgi:uncharacterized protein YkwD